METQQVTSFLKEEDFKFWSQLHEQFKEMLSE